MAYNGPPPPPPAFPAHPDCPGAQAVIVKSLGSARRRTGRRIWRCVLRRFRRQYDYSNYPERQCSNCQTVSILRMWHRFCARCGEPLVERMLTTDEFLSIIRNRNVCFHCGTSTVVEGILRRHLLLVDE